VAVAQFFARQPRGNNGSSAHFTVDNTRAVQCVRLADTAWHAPYVNHDGIGIEHGGYGSQTRGQWTDAYSAAELSVSAKLAAGLAIRYGIPVRHLTQAQLKSGSAGFIGHADATNVYGPAGGHTDPGKSFPWDVYLSMVQAEVDARRGKTWTRSKVRRTAAALGVSVAVLAGVTQVNDPKPAPTPKPAAKPYVLHRDLVRGSRGPDVVALQKRIGVAPVDGYVGPATCRKIVAVRVHYKVTPTSLCRVDAATARHLGWTRA
jgi:hypothetical protein